MSRAQPWSRDTGARSGHVGTVREDCSGSQTPSPSHPSVLLCPPLVLSQSSPVLPQSSSVLLQSSLILMSSLNPLLSSLSPPFISLTHSSPLRLCLPSAPCPLGPPPSSPPSPRPPGLLNPPHNPPPLRSCGAVFVLAEGSDPLHCAPRQRLLTRSPSERLPATY